MVAMLLLALPLAWRAGALPASAPPRCCVPAAVVATEPQVLMQRFMPMMPCTAKLTCMPGPPYCTYGLRVPASCVLYAP